MLTIILNICREAYIEWGSIIMKDKKKSLNWSSNEQKQREWEFAEAALKDAPDGTKLKRGSSFPLSYAADPTQSRLEHSFIKHGANIYALGGHDDYLGRGSFGKVKLAENRAGSLIAMKIKIIKVVRLGRSASASSAESNEAKVAAVFGIAHGEVKRSISDNNRQFKTYIDYEYLGIALPDYLAEVHNTLTESQRFLLACEIIRKVMLLHEAGYGHLDLKPENIVVDENGVPHIIDYGNAELLDENQPLLAGTPLYQLGGSDESLYTKEEMDIFALLRVLFLPREFESYDNYGAVDTITRTEDLCFVLTDSMLEANSALKIMLDTSSLQIAKGLTAKALLQLLEGVTLDATADKENINISNFPHASFFRKEPTVKKCGENSDTQELSCSDTESDSEETSDYFTGLSIVNV